MAVFVASHPVIPMHTADVTSTPPAQIICHLQHHVKSADDSLSPTAFPSEQVSPNTVVSCATTLHLATHEALQSPHAGDRDLAPTLDLVLAASNILAAHAQAGDSTCHRKATSKGTDTSADVAAMLANLVDEGLITRHTLICVVSLADRVTETCGASLNSVTVKRFLAAATLLSFKAECDEQRPLADFAKCCGLTTATLRAAETQLFSRLDFNVSTTALDFDSALDRLNIAADLDCHPMSH